MCWRSMSIGVVLLKLVAASENGFVWEMFARAWTKKNSGVGAHSEPKKKITLLHSNIVLTLVRIIMWLLKTNERTISILSNIIWNRFREVFFTGHRRHAMIIFIWKLEISAFVSFSGCLCFPRSSTRSSPRSSTRSRPMESLALWLSAGIAGLATSTAGAGGGSDTNRNHQVNKLEIYKLLNSAMYLIL